jgi:CDGSH-type Zn-finger protein
MSDQKTSEVRVTITDNGPYMVTGGLPLRMETIGTDSADESVKWIEGKPHSTKSTYALCRCGQSLKKPFCDGSHAKVGFDGTETASREPYRQQANLTQGPTLSLSDAEKLCAFARFCDPNGQVWNLVNETDEPGARQNFLRQVGECPSGRLVAWDNATGHAIEPKYELSIGLIEDPSQHCAGPLWLKGGIQIIGSDGFHYEIRNRVTLCRCGASKNKPFCDGTHAAIKFQDK